MVLLPPSFLLGVELILWLLTMLLLLPVGVLALECWAALIQPQPQVSCSSPLSLPRVALLVPAHNEAEVIEATLDTLQPELTASDRLVVIADNCTDSTATLAERTGVTVLERHNSQLKGKGYALDFALQVVAADPPDVVIVVDADCVVRPGTIAQLAAQAHQCQRPVQACYLMHPPQNSGINDRLSALALQLKNYIRPLGLTQLGWPCLLTGSGMAFPWAVLSQVSLAGSKTVDDLQLTIDLAIAGPVPLFAPQAEVTGRLMQQAAAQSQRSRWEHGHLEVIVTQVPRLLRAAWQQRRGDLLALALEISVPPLSLWLIIWGVLLILALAAAGMGGIWQPATVLGGEGGLLAGAVISAWAKFGRDLLPARLWLAVPGYIVWKLPIYRKFWSQPQTQWLHTERDVVPTKSGTSNSIT